MRIETVLNYLNKDRGYKLKSDYYSEIRVWRDWWQGKYAPFHQYREMNVNKTTTMRELYSLKMGKKVCEDWASMLLNEEMQITVADARSQELITSMLEGLSFEQRGNALVEKAFATGTGAFVLRLENAVVKTSGSIERSPGTKIQMDYLSADYIIPLTVKRGEVVDVAFVSEVLRYGKWHVYLETHRLTEKGYEITNEYFEEKGSTLIKQPTPDDVIDVMTTGSDIPWFQLIRPNIANNISDDTALGVSVFANAIDQLKGVDLAYNNFNKDFKLGGKKVFISDDLVLTGDKGESITPDDVAQQLFSVVGDSLLDESKKPIMEHNPSLRVQENVQGIQGQLDLLSFRCGLGAKYYQFDASGAGKIVTATEYVGDRQDLARNANKHNKIMAEAIKGITRGILYISKEVLGEAVDVDTEIAVEFDDSFIRDSEAERAQDMQEVRDCIMQKWEYRAKWYSEDEVTAKAMIVSLDNPLGFEGAPPMGGNSRGKDT